MKRKKFFVNKIILLFFIFILSACGKNNASSQSEISSLDQIEDINIRYVEEKREEFKNSDRKKEFEQLYGYGKYSDAIKITDALGNLVSTEFGDYNLGISLVQSNIAKGAITVNISYFDKEKEKMEDGKDIEYGPIWVDDPKLISNITFDKLESESGDMLMVSLSVISEHDQYSTYYLYNKHMNLIDYLSFSNSVDNSSVLLTRQSTDSYPNGNQQSPSGLKEATEERVNVEENILEEIDKTYKIERYQPTQWIVDDKIPVGNFPKDKGKVLKMLSIESITNNKIYPSEKGYFRIY